jgi:magnesium-protoporphyrin O-methyltransferase
MDHGSFAQTRNRLETYFDRTAAKTWEVLTSDAPVSRIRATVRAGRARLRALMLDALPRDLTGARVLDAGAGAGQMAFELAARGADVVAVDISPSLLAVARDRMPSALAGRITWRAGDMLDAAHGRFDYAVAMDSLIHYTPRDIASALTTLGDRVDRATVFTVAPRTPLLSLMHLAGQAFPRADRSPAIVPVSERRLRRELAALGDARLQSRGQVHSGFYISHAMEIGR